MVCQKKTFPTRAAAKEFAKNHKGTNGTQRPYRCVDDPAHYRGGLWHLTSMPTNSVTWYRDNPKAVKNPRIHFWMPGRRIR